MRCVPRLACNPAVCDAVAAVFLALLDTTGTLAGTSWWPAQPGPLAWSLLGVQAAAALALAFYRRAPYLVLAGLTAFLLAVTVLIETGALIPAHPGSVWAPFCITLAACGPFFFRANRRVAVTLLVLVSLLAARPWHPSLAIISIALVRVAIGPVAGLYFGARRNLVVALTERAERAERERYLLAEQARTEERARLAGEMHDVVTHRVSLMVLQAGALRVSAPDDATQRAAEELRAAGCQALDELRDLVGLLRASPQDGGAGLPPDGLAELPAGGLAALAAESATVGTPAELTQVGDPALASPVVARTVYRIVREALTNVRKHAPGSRATIMVSYGPGQVRVTVGNTAVPSGPGAARSPLAGTGSGLGLASLRQRVELVHGTLTAGPAPDGGFRLEASLPAYVPTEAPAAGAR
jgi:signal transduction histidine kinase